jgi:serine/threonine protein kinase
VTACHQCGAVLREIDRFCATCGAPAGTASPVKDALIGRTIAGNYVILDLVGIGGMGRVYRAEQRALGRTVAIKVVHPHLLSDEQSVARFYNEARAASRLNHPNSVSIIDFGRTDDGILYLAMEFLQGRDLARIMREDGPLPIPRLCEILMSVLAALGEAHVLGVVHRDLKPENVIIERLRTGSDLVKVVDFGLAKLQGPASPDSSVTSPGLVCGTPDYMSPEQGRGLALDGRGDLYSVGVILFELLTEQLPYIADTPTNVVLKHIQEAVPDPRERAPERAIPERLAEVVRKALGKLPEERYQTASDMADALRRALSEILPSARDIACPACGVRSPAGKRFCGECGAPLLQRPISSTQSPRMSLPPGVSIGFGESLPIVGREEELEVLRELAALADGRVVTACISGEAGVGKTRLLGDVADQASADGWLVVGAGPHETAAPVPYYPIRAIVSSLLDCDDDGLCARADELEAEEALVAAGLRELVAPAGLRGAEGGSRAGAVAAALGFALRQSLEQTSRAQALLMVDDLHACDGLSVQALGQLGKHAHDTSLLVLTATQHAADAERMPGCRTIPLRGLSMTHARAVLAGGVTLRTGSAPADDSRTFLPLYVEQLRALGLPLDAGSNGAPARLADAVLQRLQRLSLGASRTLQAACVLGSRCRRDALFALAGTAGTSGLDQLEVARLLTVGDDYIEVVHPFIRELVEASIPAEARKALHARALEVAGEVDAQLEVRAHHAHGAGETLTAIMLLERAGDLAHERGDPGSAVRAYRAGLGLVRRELLESGDTSFEEALVSFSRRLGNALARAADLTSAEGVLREALEFCGPSSVARSYVLLGLGRVMATKNRLRDAHRFFGEAVAIAAQRGDEAARAAVHATIGEVRRLEGNIGGAIASYSAALQCLSESRADALATARIAVELAVTQLESDAEPGVIEDTLDRAEELAVRADAPHLLARVLLGHARLFAARGDGTAQERCLRKAGQAAGRAGDAILLAQVDRALRHLLQVSEHPTL